MNRARLAALLAALLGLWVAQPAQASTYFLEPHYVHVGTGHCNVSAWWYQTGSHIDSGGVTWSVDIATEYIPASSTYGVVNGQQFATVAAGNYSAGWSSGQTSFGPATIAGDSRLSMRCRKQIGSTVYDGWLRIRFNPDENGQPTVDVFDDY